MKPNKTHEKVLEILRKHGPCSAGWVAKKLWPDSPGWRRMSGGWNGRRGKMMPMRAGRILWAMRELGLCRQIGRTVNDGWDDYRWELS